MTTPLGQQGARPRKRAKRRRRTTTSRLLQRGCECLESRICLATVTTTADSGPGSLRQAIIDANNGGTGELITFELTAQDPNFVDADSQLPNGDAEPDLFVFDLQSPLPAVTNSGVSIDGFMQAFADSNPNGPEVVLNGADLTSGNGLDVQAGSVTIRNLALWNFPGHGIAVESSDNSIESNDIGYDSLASTNVGNGGDGVNIQGTRNLVQSNAIANNQGNGINVLGGEENTLRFNMLLDNSLLGIDLGGDSVTTNDSDDGDEGANRLQNYPVITDVTVDSVTTLISFELTSTPASIFEIDFYANTTPDDTGFGEGYRYLGTHLLTQGDGSFYVDTAILTGFVGMGESVVATATDEDGNTSEFSANYMLPLPPGANDNYTLAEDGSLTTSTIDGVLANDNIPPNAQFVEATLTSSPSVAESFTFQSDGTFTYAPVPNFSGSDSFSYDLNVDGLILGPFTAFLTINSMVDAPLLSVSDVSGNESDIINLNWSVSEGDPDGPEFIDTIMVSGLPAEVAFTAGTNAGNGNWMFSPTEFSTVSLISSDNVSFVASISATAADPDANQSQTATATANIDILNVAPSINGQVSSDNSTAFLNLEAFDPSAVDQQSEFTFTIDWGDGTSPVNVIGSSTTSPQHTYNQEGDYTVLVTATDKDGGQSSALSLPVQIVTTTSNRPPTATPDQVEGDSLAIVILNLLTTDTGAGVDSDPDGDTLSAVSLSSPFIEAGQATASDLGAIISIDAQGNFSYDPTTSAALQELPDGQQTTESFTYQISDGQGGTDTATVQVTITGATPPFSISGTVFEDTNTDQQFNLTENGLAGLIVYMDDNLNRTRDPGERMAVTDATGFYEFSSPTPNVTYLTLDVGTDVEPTFPHRRFERGTDAIGPSSIRKIVAADLRQTNFDNIIAISDNPGELLAREPISIDGRPQDVVVGDWNNDGFPDIAVSDVGAGSPGGILIFENDNGTVRLTQQIAVGDGPIRIASGDLTGDGVPDLATVNFRSRDVSLVMNDGTGNFTSSYRLNAFSNPSAVLISNSGGSGSLIVADSDDSSITRWQYTDSGPVMIAETSLSIRPTALTEVNVGDANTLAAASYFDDAWALIALDDADAPQSFGVFPSFARPTQIGSDDMNGDGSDDIVLVHGEADAMTVNYATTNGFSRTFSYEAGGGSQSYMITHNFGTATEVRISHLDSRVTLLSSPRNTHTLRPGEEGTRFHFGIAPHTPLLDFSGELLGESQAGGEGEADLHNSVLPVDVDNNGRMEPRDAVLVINELNSRARGQRSPAQRADDAFGLELNYYDVSGDSLLTPRDAVLVINRLNDASQQQAARAIATEATEAIEPPTPYAPLPLQYEISVSSRPEHNAQRASATDESVLFHWTRVATM